MDLLLAIRRDRTLREVRLEKTAAAGVGQAFTDMDEKFRSDDIERLPYQPAYKPAANELLELVYDLPPSLWACRTVLDSTIPALDNSSLRKEPPIALVAVTCGRHPTFRFQATDNKNLLHTKWVLLTGPKHFHLNQNAGLVIGQHLDAVHEGGKLYFKSEHNVRRFLDLEKFFREATDEEIENVLNVKPFTIDNLPGVKAAANTLVRRKLAQLAASQQKFNLPALKIAARKAKVRITERNGALVVPSTPRELQLLVRLLHDDYLESLLGSGRVYRTNSKLLV
jgi:hypothetical protein